MMKNYVPDQMGVELGKVLAKNILAQLGKPEDVQGHDSSVSNYAHESGLDLHRWHASTDDWPHPLLPEVQEGINENEGKRGRLCVKFVTKKRGKDFL
jgi:hypothetical protein